MSLPTPALPVTTLLARHEGPALLATLDGPLEANPQAKALLRDGQWWPAVATWLQQKNTAQTERLTVRVTDRAALEAAAPGAHLPEFMIEWQALPLAGEQWLLLGRDATLEHNLTLALADSRTRFKELLDLSSDYVWETDRTGRFTFISERGLLGWSTNEAVGKRAHELGLVAVDALTTPFLTQTPVHEAQLWLKDRNDELRCLLTSALPKFDATGSWQGARGICRDVTEEQQQGAQLASARTRERIVSHILRVIRDGLSPEREFEAAARALTHALSADGCAIFRHDKEQWHEVAHYGAQLPPASFVLCQATLNRGDALKLDTEGREWLACRTQHHRAVNGALVCWRSNGQRHWGADELRLVEAVAEQVGVVWAQVRAQEALIERADKDGLTKLTNQRAFAEAARQRLERGSPGAVLLNIDLDNFKTINDHLGHGVGDDVLKKVATLLERSIRGGDIAARVGGDEFLLWLERTDSEGAKAVAQRVIEGIGALAASLPDLPKKLGASIGIAPVHAGDTFASLMKRADETMYKAKHSGKGHAEVAP